MKIINFIIIVVIACINFSYAKSDLPKEWGVARKLSDYLYNNMALGGKDIPTSWNDFIVIDWIKNGRMPRSAYDIKLINSFSLVPAAPFIKPQQGISSEYSGKRLFLISRYENYTESSTFGRCVVLINPDSDNSKGVVSAAHYIPEETAQLILEQIGGFNPIEQPPAFDDDFIFQNRDSLKGNYLDSLIRKLERERGLGKPGIIPTRGEYITAQSKVFWMIGLGIMCLLIFAYLIIRSFPKRR